MTETIDAVALFGTTQPVPERRLLQAGPLSAILEEGNLRTIRFGGVEAVRAVNYLARDTSWGTYAAELSGLEVEEMEDGFRVAYRGLCAGPEGRYSYRMSIRGEVSGRLVLEADGEALTDFPTNRTGFVVLHPSEAAGAPLTVRHSDGTVKETRFSEIISADQPVFDIAALTHEIAPGVHCTVGMEGDAFEMEDQRNWADASFKTYIRPLSKPRPYVLKAGGRDLQRITIEFRGPPPAADAGKAVGDRAELKIGGPAGKMPEMALFLDPDDMPAALANASGMRVAQEVIVRFDPGRGHDGRALADAAKFASAIGARLAVEAIFDARDPQAEAARLAAAIRASGSSPSAVLVSPRREFKTRPSGSLPEGEQPIEAVVEAVRAAVPGATVGAGTPSFFTEFNRNPPLSEADFVFFGVSSIVHAADDISVMETLSVYPTLIASARRLCPGKPIRLGPCTLGARHNPYGEDVTPNPSGERKPMARFDPRQTALFGAAFMVGVAAQAAAAGIEHLTLAAPTGPFGLLEDSGRPRPVHGVHAALGAAAGADRLQIDAGRPGLAALAFSTASGRRALLANLTPEPIPVEMPGETASAAVLMPDGAFRDLPGGRHRINLGAYRTVMLSLPPG